MDNNINSDESIFISGEDYRIAIQRHTGKMVMRYDISTRKLLQSQNSASYFGMDTTTDDVPESLISVGFIATESIDTYIKFFNSMISGKPEGSCIIQFKNRIQEFLWFHLNYTVLYDRFGSPFYAIISFEDVTEQREKEIAYERWQHEFKELSLNKIDYYEFNITKNLIEREVVNLSSKIPVSVSRTFEGITTYFIANYIYPEDRDGYLKFFTREFQLASYYTGVRELKFEHRRINSQGNVFWALAKIQLLPDPYSENIKAFVFVSDIDAQKKHELEIEYRLHSDVLTGLLNRNYFAEQTNAICAQSSFGNQHTFVILDIDCFKHINDALGHSFGDNVLIDTAKSLKKSLRNYDLIGRLGGDEFIILLKNIPHGEVLKRRIEHICNLVHHNYGESFVITASVGAATYPDDGTTFDELYLKADMALYEAKRQGKNRYVFFKPYMQLSNNHTTPIENAERSILIKDFEDKNKLDYYKYDKLTGALNYDMFRDEVMRLLNFKNTLKYAIWYSDLKKFKFVNDIYGYETGNRVLKYWSKIICDDLLEGEPVARVSADCFISFMSYNSNDELVERFKKISGLLANYGELSGKNFTLEVSSGIYCIEDKKDILSVDDMIDRANIAQKSIKQMSGSLCSIYNEEMRLRILQEKELEAQMRTALINHEFRVYFQPIVDIQNGVIMGAEALVRWHKPDGTIIYPDTFIPLFEKNGFIVELDRYMYEAVCAYLHNRIMNGRKMFSVSINVSRVSVFQNNFISFYTSVKSKYGIQDDIIIIECTESTVCEDVDALDDIATIMREHGVKFALDDFGCGYSSLNMLKNITVDFLKLDMMFIREGINENRMRIIVSSIISMAKRLDVNVIAEGVENEEQYNTLKELNCDMVQGFLFDKPLSIDMFEKTYDSVINGIE